MASKSLPSAGCVLRFVSTVWMKLVAAVPAAPPVARVAPNRWPASTTWRTRMSMLVHQSTPRPGSPSRM